MVHDIVFSFAEIGIIRGTIPNGIAMSRAEAIVMDKACEYVRATYYGNDGPDDYEIFDFSGCNVCWVTGTVTLAVKGIVFCQ